ncbi:DUF6880 family protein, partial [uncultured Jannaschia sp.]|uniref:DUF6880 family protein n=1 Tax=uncultured Jannaschia sp. TaxID=293347 RepID=UPI00342F91CC
GPLDRFLTLLTAVDRLRAALAGRRRTPRCRGVERTFRDSLRMIEETVVPQDADEAFGLLWSFLQLAPSIHERTDDSNGAIGKVMDDAAEIIANVAPSLNVTYEVLADRILDAVAGADYGEFDGIIPATAEALGDDGLAHLKEITEAWAEVPPSDAEMEA